MRPGGKAANYKQHNTVTTGHVFPDSARQDEWIDININIAIHIVSPHSCETFINCAAYSGRITVNILTLRLLPCSTTEIACCYLHPKNGVCGGALGPLSRLRLTVVSTTFSTLKPLQLLLPHATPCTWLGTKSESVYLNKCLRLLYRSMGLSSPLPIPAWLEFLRCPPSYLSVRYGYRTLSKMIATGDKGLYKCFLKPCLVSSSPYTINTQYILYCWLT